MDEIKDSLARKRPLPILSRINYNQWFRLGRLHFEAKNQDFVLETTLDEYAKYAMATTSSTSDNRHPQMAYDQEKRKEFKKADAEVRYIITICVEDFDQEAIQDIKSIKKI